MARTRRAAVWATAASAAMIATMALHAPAQANPSDPGPAKIAKGKNGDIRKVGTNYNHGRKLPISKAESQKAPAAAQAQVAANGDAEVGDVKSWLALDDTQNRIYRKNYTLRGLGNNIEVWVANDRAFPSSTDCRNQLNLTDITDGQVSNFINEFDNNIYPKESQSFSVPPDRDGSNSLIPGPNGDPQYYKAGADQADDIVVLVDNVRDDNYYDPTGPTGKTYIAGFFYSIFNEYVDRNVMTIDAFDWLHRTGATPPDDSAKPEYQACANELGRPGLGTSAPHQYEGTFAHEYQHLLEYYEDPDELSWINEGLSDYAQTLVGYVDTRISPDAKGADGHIKCFDGYQDPSFGGPENSLTNWQDQGAAEILCDYGAAYSFMNYLYSHYGEKFMSALHREDGGGMTGLNTVLQQFGSKETAMSTIHKWAAEQALDQALDQGRKLTGGRASDYQASFLNSKINWDNPQAYNSPGAPANGSDYVRLRNAAGTYLSAKQLRSIQFTGDTTLAPDPVEWTAEATPPNDTSAVSCGDNPAGSAPAALYSGCGDNLDRSIARQVSVPASGGQLSFETLYNTEPGWDFGFVQVSTDGGQTWKSLATEDTTSDHDPGAVPQVTSQLPGFTDDSGTWKTEHADLTPYAGKDVLIGFRYITDPGTTGAGYWVRNIDAAGTTLPSDSLAGWKSYSQFNPQKVHGFTVQLIAIDDKGKAWIYQLPLNSSFSGSLSGDPLDVALGKTATVVSAIVMQDDPTETVTKQAGYQLKVNGVLQPGG